MRIGTSLLLLTLLVAPTWAQQTLEHNRKLVLFELPNFELEGVREGERTVASYVKMGDAGKIRLDITITDYDTDDELDFEERFTKHKKRFEKKWARALEELEIPGAAKALRFYSSSPFEGANLVLFTEDFVCRMMLTAKEESRDQVPATLDQLIQTTRVEQKAARPTKRNSPG